MALAAATALAGRRYANCSGLVVGHIGARASMTSLQEGMPDSLRHLPLPFLTYVDRFWRLLEIEGNLTSDERNGLVEAMADNGIARTIRDGIKIDEAVVFSRPSPGSRRPAGNDPGNQLLKGRASLAAGEIRVASQGNNWQVGAAALDEHTCLVKMTGALHVVGDSIASLRGAIPEEMLLGGLASCTCIYIARNAQFHDIAVDAVSVRVRTQLPVDPSQPITQVEKIAEITGEFTEEEAAKLTAFAQYCAFGVTLGRGTAIEDSLAFDETNHPTVAPTGLASLDRSPPTPNDPAYCTDGSCCVPVFEKQAS
ncbi:MAG: OsmC family protein [Novosphingobium sp.]